MKTIKIDCADFWGGLIKTDNYFYNLLSTKYHVLIDENDPDLLFFSVGYGKTREREKYLNHRCKKVFFTGENVRPNFDYQSVEYPNYSIGRADIALTFDYSNDNRNYRFPLWAFFINWFDRPYNHDRDPAYLVPTNHLVSRDHICKKGNFCNFVFSNNSGKRIEILELISKYKHVDCAGKLANNFPKISGRGDQKDKIDFISKYKFTIAAENSKHDGYTTEKIIHPFSVGSIPIYWGSSRVSEEFNPKSFIDTEGMSEKQILDLIMFIDYDENAYNKILKEPIFTNNTIPENVMPKNVLSFIESVL